MAGPLVIDKLEASVNASLVLLSDIRKFRKTLSLRTQLDPLFAGTTLASKGANATNQEIVEFLINERLISLQFPISDSEVEQEINSIQANNRIDRATLRRALQEQGFRFEEYFDLIKVSTSKRNLIERDIRTKVSISEDDVKNYFYNHYARDSSTPMTYQVRIITVSPQNYKSAQAAQETAQKAHRELLKGTQFEEVARTYSDDPSSSAGGDLGVLSEDQMSSQIKDELKKLKIGKHSSVLGNAERGFFILKLEDVKSGGTERFEKMKDEIRNQLIASEYQHQIALWLDRQRQTAFIHRAGEPSVPGLKKAGGPSKKALSKKLR